MEATEAGLTDSLALEVEEGATEDGLASDLVVEAASWLGLVEADGVWVWVEFGCGEGEV